MNPLRFLRKDQARLELAGTDIPKFEQSAIHAGARLAFAPINQVLGIDDPAGELATEFLQTAEGIAIVDLLRGYSLHALTRQRLTAKAA